jgi:DNA-directed RNA polymerase specialized sigma subunit
MRFVDFARCIRRDRTRCTQSLEATELLDPQAYQLPGLIGCDQSSPRIGEDPAVIAEANEERERLARAVAKLDERQRRVWEAILSGATRRMIAEEFGVTSAVAMHWRQEVIAVLKAAVKDRSE